MNISAELKEFCNSILFKLEKILSKNSMKKLIKKADILVSPFEFNIKE